jgi:hypothetical protein
VAAAQAPPNNSRRCAVTATVIHGDARHLPLADVAVDAIICDPPYEIGFMGRQWDSSGVAYDIATWQEALRVLKPGGHLLAFGGTRTYHRMACAIEDAGFDIRDSIGLLGWTYGGGFPKSLNVSEAVDRHRANPHSTAVDAIRTWLNARRLEAGLSLKQVNDALGLASNGGGLASGWMTNPTSKALPSWGQWLQLKTLIGFGDDMDVEMRRLCAVKTGDDRPILATELRDNAPSGIVNVDGCARKLVTRRITTAASETAARWDGWGTALKPAWEPIVVARKPFPGTVAANVLEHGTGALNIDACRTPAGADYAAKCASVVGLGSNRNGHAYGEWARARTDSTHPAGRWPTNLVIAHHPHCGDRCQPECHVPAMDRGTDRYFPIFRYEPKADSAERPVVAGVAHPTVKPLALMRWLCRLVTPPGGIILDQFAGSGTTLEAATLDGFRAVGVEREAAHLPLIRYRLDRSARRRQPGMSTLSSTGATVATGQGDLLADLFGGVG